MADDYACGSSRNKKKDKAKEKRKNPYKTGGRFRSSITIEETKNSSKTVINVKKKKKDLPKKKKK